VFAILRSFRGGESNSANLETLKNIVVRYGYSCYQKIMAWRIEENVVRGEIDNRTFGRVHGKVWLTGRGDPLILELTGNCHKDLAGCRFTFTNPAPKSDGNLAPATDQSGAVGDMTAARKVRVIENFDYLEMKKGKRFPEHMANCLYLEWFSHTNGRVVIESTDYQITVSEPAWRLSPDEEIRQHQANADAMRSFMERAAGALDPREEAAYDGEPKDEFEWELFLRASDRRTTKLGELMEKYHDHPERDRLIAREMGWTWIEEMLDAEAECGAEEEPDDNDAAGYDEPETVDMDEDPIEHPLVARLVKRSGALMKLAGDRRDRDLEEMVGGFIAIGPKIAGALGIVRPGRKTNNEFNGLVVAKLKRALGELSRALNAANQLKQRKTELPFSIDEWVAEMLEARQEILSLMNEFRR
jgi:hypothetical protein